MTRIPVSNTPIIFTPPFFRSVRTLISKHFLKYVLIAIFSSAASLMLSGQNQTIFDTPMVIKYGVKSSEKTGHMVLIVDSEIEDLDTLMVTINNIEIQMPVHDEGSLYIQKYTKKQSKPTYIKMHSDQFKIHCEFVLDKRYEVAQINICKNISKEYFDDDYYILILYVNDWY